MQVRAGEMQPLVVVQMVSQLRYRTRAKLVGTGIEI